MSSALPAVATTGIGSLPPQPIGLALQGAFAHDVPFLPELERMMPAALEGLPGVDAAGTIALDAWRRGRDGLGRELDAAMASFELAAFEPSEHARSCFRPFLREVEARRLPFAKVQLAGPASVRWLSPTSSGVPASDVVELDQQLFQLILARAIALVHAVRRTGARPILFLDEPGLGRLVPSDPRHAVVLQELRMLIAAARGQGALVGLHCCANTAWGAVLGLGLDILSFDARLSLDAVLDERAAVRAFIDAGGTFALGVVPTGAGEPYVLAELIESVEVSLRSTIPRFDVARLLVTPACGLALHSAAEADAIVAEVREAQAGLRRPAG